MDDHAMELCTLKLFAIGSFEFILQLLYIDEDKGCIIIGRRTVTPFVKNITRYYETSKYIDIQDNTWDK